MLTAIAAICCAVTMLTVTVWIFRLARKPRQA